jgi:hypothetical protein
MNKISFAALILVLTILPIGQSFAQSAGGDVSCIEIYPCDENGILLPEFADVNSACYEYFASQCKAADSCDDLHGTVKILTFENQYLAQQNELLKKKLRKAKKKLRRANS